MDVLLNSSVSLASFLVLFIVLILTGRIVPWWMHEDAVSRSEPKRLINASMLQDTPLKIEFRIMDLWEERLADQTGERVVYPHKAPMTPEENIRLATAGIISPDEFRQRTGMLNGKKIIPPQINLNGYATYDDMKYHEAKNAKKSHGQIPFSIGDVSVPKIVTEPTPQLRHGSRTESAFVEYLAAQYENQNLIPREQDGIMTPTGFIPMTEMKTLFTVPRQRTSKPRMITR